MLVGHSIAGQEMSYLAAQHRRTIAALIYLEAAYRYAYDAWRVREGFPEPATSANDSTGRRSTSFILPEAERRQQRGMPAAARDPRRRPAVHRYRPTGVSHLRESARHRRATPDPAFDRFDEAVTERQARAFERGVPGHESFDGPARATICFSPAKRTSSRK